MSSLATSASDRSSAGAQNAAVHFRMSSRLLSAVEAKARREGRTLSEILRDAVAREVEQTHGDANAALGAISADIALAAQGDIAKQREFRDGCRDDMQAATSPIQCLLSAVEGLCWARFAASHGDRHDALELAHSIGQFCTQLENWDARDIGVQFSSEFLTILSRAADQGDEHAAKWLNSAVAAFPAEIVEEAKETIKVIAESEA